MKVEENLGSSWRCLVDELAAGVFRITPEGRLLWANFSLAELLGFDSPGELIEQLGYVGRQWWVSARDCGVLWRTIVAKGAVKGFETLVRKKDGTPVPVSLTVVVVRDDNGVVRHLDGAVEDITARRQMEDAMFAEQNRFRVLSENAPVGIAIINPDGGFDYVNPKFSKIFGYVPDDVPNGKEWFRKAYPDREYRHEVVRVWKKNLERFRVGEEKPWTFDVTCKDGSKKTIYFVPVRLVTGHHIMTCEDVTERVRAQEAIERSEQTLKAILWASPVGIGLLDKLNIVWANHAASRMVGYDRGELDGLDLRALYLSDEERCRVRERFNLQKETETQWVRKDRSIIDVRLRVVPLKDRKNVMIAVAEDITDQNLAFRLLEQSRQELKTLGRAKGKALDHLSHELKTPLAVAQGSLRVLRKRIKSGGQDRSLESMADNMERNLDRLLRIQQAAEKIIDVSSGLEAGMILDDFERFWKRIEESTGVLPEILSRWNEVKAWVLEHVPRVPVLMKRIDLSEQLQAAVQKARRLAVNRQINLEAGEVKTLCIMGNPEVMEDTMDGLLKNAIENTPDGGNVRVGVRRENDEIVVEFKDTGIGICEEHRRFVFDGFYHMENTNIYSSKRPYEFGAGGKGLDLFTIKAYGLRYGFKVRVTSSRCPNIPTDKDLCPGDISLCRSVEFPHYCMDRGGTTVAIVFPAERMVPEDESL